jgi:endonuclease/exonuclease/phosphatase family metal-dependent hydrolase
MDVSFVTYNLMHIYAWRFNPCIRFPETEGNIVPRARLQGQELQRLGATFILVQEAFHAHGRKVLIETLRPQYEVVNHDRYNIHSVVRFGSGLLIFYRRDVCELIEQHFTQFPFSFAAVAESVLGCKGGLVARFRTHDGHRIDLANVHLCSLCTSSQLLSQQLQLIKQRLLTPPAALGEADLAILGGDFNTGPGPGAVRRYLAELPLSPLRRVCRKQKARITWDPGNTLVEAGKFADSNKEQIDHILVYSPNGNVRGQTQVVLNRKFRINDQRTHLSDHYGLELRLRMP